MPTRSTRRPMRLRTKIIVCCVIIVVATGIGGVLVASWIIDRLPAIRASVQREFRNERLWGHARRLERELDGDQFADLGYSVGVGSLHIDGSLPDREALDRVISAVFACPDEVVFNLDMRVSLSNPHVGDQARARMTSPRAVAKGPAPTWTLKIDVLELLPENAERPEGTHRMIGGPGNVRWVVLSERAITLNREGSVLREELLSSIPESAATNLGDNTK